MRAIYEPTGKAREYSPLALNLYNGCVHGCVYCYVPSVVHKNRDEFTSSVNERENIFEAVRKDCKNWVGEKYQVLLCFTCDPYAVNTGLTRKVVVELRGSKFPVAILSKGFDKIENDFEYFDSGVKIGSTLTFMSDEMSRRYEPGAALPNRRLEVLREWHKKGGKTFASFEPILDTNETLKILLKSLEFVDQYKIGRTNYFSGSSNNEDYKNLIQKIMPILREAKKEIYIKTDLAKIVSYDYFPAERDKDFQNLRGGGIE